MPATHSRPTQAQTIAGVLLIFGTGLVMGFAVGREFPTETKHEKECRAWAKQAYVDMNNGRDDTPVLFSACMRGGR